MGIISNLFLKSHDLMDSENGWTPIFGGFFGSSTRSATGKTITPEKAMSLSAYFAAIALISEDVGKLPLITYQRRKGSDGRDPRPEHPVYNLLKTQPNEKQTAMSFIEQVTAWALGWGYGYAEIGRNQGGDVDRLEPIHPSRVIRPHTGQNITDYYHVHCVIDGKQTIIEIEESDILVIPGRAGGLSIAKYAANAIGIAIAADEYAGVFYKNGANIGGILKYPASLKPEARKQLKEAWASHYAGNENAHKTAVIDGGGEWQPTAIPNKDSQFIESRHFQIEEIARWFRIPPHKLQELGKATFSNIEQQSIEYVSDTLQPWLTRWEQEIKRKLFVNDPGYYADFLVTALLQGDSAARANLYKSLFNMGALSPNDMRKKENMNPIDDPAGDEYYIQLNMTTLAKAAAAEPDPEPEPEPEPDPEPDDDDEVETEKDSRRIISAMDSVIFEIADRVLTKEQKACERIIKKQSDPDEAKKEIGEFIRSQVVYLEEELICVSNAVMRFYNWTDNEPRFSKASELMVSSSIDLWTAIIDEEILTETDFNLGRRAFDIQKEVQTELLEYIKTKDK